jgi:polysaccharide pyruvyl transferase WcaK-like protein
MRPLGLDAMLAGETEAHGILVGGGYIIHTHKMQFLEEYRSDGLVDFAVPGLWLGAALAASVRDIPLAWNAPGVPHPFMPHQRTLIDAALRAADYLSLRDRESYKLLGAAPGLPIEIVPDSVAAIAQLWSRGSLDRPFQGLIQRKAADSDAHYFVLHFRGASLDKMTPAEAAVLVDDFAGAHGLTPILVAIGESLGDDAFARTIASHLRTKHILLDDPLSLIEIAAAIGCSRLYVGESLHGYVVASAYGVPGIAVARPFFRKFKGFADHTGRTEDLVRSWQEAFVAAAARTQEKTRTRIPDTVFSELDTHWRRIGEALSDPNRNRIQRQAFLQSWLAAGIGAGGTAWAHAPFVKRIVASAEKGSANTRPKSNAEIAS